MRPGIGHNGSCTLADFAKCIALPVSRCDSMMVPLPAETFADVLGSMSVSCVIVDVGSVDAVVGEVSDSADAVPGPVVAAVSELVDIVLSAVVGSGCDSIDAVPGTVVAAMSDSVDVIPGPVVVAVSDSVDTVLGAVVAAVSASVDVIPGPVVVAVSDSVDTVLGAVVVGDTIEQFWMSVCC